MTKSAYNSMLQQQQTLEASLRSEIAANQVKIEQLENGIRVRMSNDLLYRSGSVELHPNGRAALDKVAGQLATMASQGNQIDVVGNTDDVPVGRELAERYPTNWELAGARAAVVVRYLQEKGVNPVQLEAISDGAVPPGRVQRHARRAGAEPSHGPAPATRTERVAMLRESPGRSQLEEAIMSRPTTLRRSTLGLWAVALALFIAVAGPTGAHAQAKKPNIVVIMGDDIGMWNIGAYHRGLMAGRTPTSTSWPRKACSSPTTTRKRAARRGAPTSSPASCPSAPA